MSALWNLPFAALVLAALWTRLGRGEGLVRALEPLFDFFGIGGEPERAATDLLGVAGVTGLLFVAWSDRIAVVADAWLAVDVIATSIGMGLLGAWLLGRAGAPGAAAARPAPAPRRELATMEVDELPQRGSSGSGPHGPGAPGGAM
ncbi:MAG TPA: hypothetical protein VKZ63_18000 [Kofleriaceae bacterium]|nr:hypothetical protein [Kofleriaceae bacterium]